MITFGQWILDQETGELSSNGDVTRLAEQQLQALMVLLRAGQHNLVLRETFITALWPDGRVVEYDQSLNTCIRKLRKALSDNAESPEFIETVPGKGYRLLIAPKPYYGKDQVPIMRRRHWAGGILVGCFLLLLIVYINQNEPSERVNPAPVKRLVVLPFDTSESSDNALAKSAFAIREVLLNELSIIPANTLAIVSGDSVFGWQNNTVMHRQSDLLLSAMIQEDPLNIQMFFRINAADGQVLWSDSIHWLKGAGIKQQTTIAAQLFKGIVATAQLPEDISKQLVLDAQMVSFGADSNRFNEAVFLAGQKTPENNKKAIEILLQLVAENPDHGEAMIWLATLYQRDGGANIRQRQQRFSEALKWVDRGLRLLPDAAELYRVRAYVELYGQWQPDVAKNSILKAVSLAPNNAAIRSVNAAVAITLGETEKSLEQARLAQTLDPLAMLINADLCWYLNFARQFDAALKECQRTLDLQPNAAWIRLGLIEAQLKTQNWQGAHTAFQSLSSAPSNPSKNFQQAFSLAYMTLIQQLQKGYAAGNIDPYMIAAMYAQLGKKAESIQWLNKAKTDKSGFFIFAAVDPRFQSIIHEPAFKLLLSTS